MSIGLKSRLVYPHTIPYSTLYPNQPDRLSLKSLVKLMLKGLITPEGNTCKE
jgi:hypothetical protein